MIKSYFESLPQDYFGDLYSKVTGKLTRGENICIAAVPGFGSKTVFNFLDYHIKKDKLFENTVVFDPEIERYSLLNYVKILLKKNLHKSNLVIVRFFEKIKDKHEVLEKLDSLRRRNPKSLVFLIITDHTPITNSTDYQAKSTVFFNEIFYMKPFNVEQTKKMTVSLEQFYGWKIDEDSFNKIYTVSGGIPRLIKYICKEYYESRTPVNNFYKLQSSPQISFQLSLLTSLILRLPKEKLIILGIVNEKDKIISTLLKDYFKNYQNESVRQLFSNLTRQESKLLTYLLENQNDVVSIDKIADLIEMSEDDFSLWAIYKLISRLKPKVKNNFQIKNIKGNGYILRNIQLAGNI